MSIYGVSPNRTDLRQKKTPPDTVTQGFFEGLPCLGTPGDDLPEGTYLIRIEVEYTRMKKGCKGIISDELSFYPKL